MREFAANEIRNGGSDVGLCECGHEHHGFGCWCRCVFRPVSMELLLEARAERDAYRRLAAFLPTPTSEA